MHLTNLKLLVGGGLMCSNDRVLQSIAVQPIWPGTGYFKHEEDAAGPKMAKRLRRVLDDRAASPASA